MARPDGGQFANVLAPTLYDLSISSAERSPQVPRTDAVLDPGLGFREWIWGEHVASVSCTSELVKARLSWSRAQTYTNPRCESAAQSKPGTMFLVRA